jgi:hypothetical protein
MSRFVSIIVCLAALAVADAGRAANPVFSISIDANSWRKFGWRYPVTYVFQLPDAEQELKASRRDGPGDPWAALVAKPCGEPFNGVECFRYDPHAKRAFVSVGVRSNGNREVCAAKGFLYDREAIDVRSCSAGGQGCSPWLDRGPECGEVRSTDVGC